MVFAFEVYSSDSRVDKASSFGAVDLSFIPSRVKLMIVKLVFIPFLLDAQHYRDCVKNKPANLRVIPLEKAVSGILPFHSGGQMAGNTLASSS